MHIMTDDKDLWIKSDRYKWKEVIDQWKAEGYKNFRVIQCVWDEEFEVCIDTNTLYDEGDISGLYCNRHLEINIDLEEKYPSLSERKYC